MPLTVGSLVAKFGLDAKQFLTGMDAVRNKLRTTSDKVADAASNMSVFKLKLAAVAVAAYQTGKALSSMIREVQSLHRTMVVVEGSASEAAKTWGLIDKTAKQLGISIGTLSKNYISLTAASKGSSLSQKQLQELFVAVSKKAAVLALTNEQVQRTFRALQDMASSGVISMQDLRLQLGQALPGAMMTMASALDVTVPKLKEMVSSGQLLAEDVFPLLTAQLEKETAEGVKALGKGLRTSIAGLSSSFFKLKEVLADSIISDALSGIISVMSAGLDVVIAFGNASNVVWKTMKGFASWVARAITERGEFDTLGTLGIDLGNLKTTVNEVKEATEEVKESVTDQQDKLKELFDNSGEALAAWEADVVGSFEGVLAVFTSFVSDLATGVDVSFTKMLNNMAKGILDFTMEMLVVKPLLDWFRTWLQDVTPGGGASGGVASSILGMLGKPKAMAGGGMITEPVLGIGANSKSSYLIGEAGPEAVIPASQMGGGGGGGTNNINVTINALDSKSVADLMRDNPQAITGPLVEAIKGGDRGLASSLRLAVN
jgi:tape measure domain-containing protein